MIALVERYNENNKILAETLNVKLRYEEIIKNLIANESSGSRLNV